MIQGLQDQITTFYRFLKTYNLTDFTGPFNCNTILKKGIFGKDTTIKLRRLKERWGGGMDGWKNCRLMRCNLKAKYLLVVFLFFYRFGFRTIAPNLK